MAKKKQEFHPHLTQKAEVYDIVQLALLPEHTDEIVAIKPNVEELMSDIQQLIDTGHEITISANKHTGGYSVLLRGAYAASVNHRKAYYSNADSVQMALVVCLYKNFTLSAGGLWVETSMAPKRTFS